MSRVQRIVVASALLVVAVLGLVSVASQIGVTYYLPPDDSGFASTHVAVFAPAVVGTVVAAFVVLALVVLLIVAVRRAVPLGMWIAAAVVALVALITPFVVGMLDRPTF